jgi:hypothetical protein
MSWPVALRVELGARVVDGDGAVAPFPGLGLAGAVVVEPALPPVPEVVGEEVLT